MSGVYPRVGGETSRSGNADPRWFEVYPRVGGETSRRLRRTSRERGLSPRGRETAVRQQLRRLIRGLSPAWAGKPQT